MQKYYTLTLETLAPVYIGCGNALTKLDYIYSKKSNTIYILDPMRLFHGLKQCNLLSTFESGLSRNMSMTDFVIKNAVAEQAYRKWAAASYSVQGLNLGRGQYEIHSFIKDAYGMPYIPGSGLKGAIRTALEVALLLKRASLRAEKAGRVSSSITSAQKKRDAGEKLRPKGLLQRENNDLTTSVFHTLNRKENKPEDMLNDCMAGLMISDSRPVSPDALTLCQKLDIFLKDEQTLPLLRESLKPGTKLTFDVTINTEQLNSALQDILIIDDGAVDTSEPDLAVKAILQAGADAFNLYDDRFRKAFLDYLPEKIDPENEMYLYLGGGTGFWHKTVLNALYSNPDEGAENTAKLLDLQFPKAHHTRFTAKKHLSPKAIKAAEYQKELYEMGLCVLSFEEKEI